MVKQHDTMTLRSTDFYWSCPTPMPMLADRETDYEIGRCVGSRCWKKKEIQEKEWPSLREYSLAPQRRDSSLLGRAGLVDRVPSFSIWPMAQAREVTFVFGSESNESGRGKWEAEGRRRRRPLGGHLRRAAIHLFARSALRVHGRTRKKKAAAISEKKTGWSRPKSDSIPIQPNSVQ